MSIIYFPFAFFPSNLFYINYSALVFGGSFNLCRKWQKKKKKMAAKNKYSTTSKQIITLQL